MELGARIVAWLKAKGLTQSWLASAVDVSPSAVTAWVKGSNDPSHKTLLAIVDALGISMAEFYGPVPAPASSKAVA